MTTKLMIAAAALFAAGGAFAQTTGTPPADSTVPSASPSPSGDPMAHDSMPMAADSAMTLTQGSDGKWMMGDRPATKAEIAAYKKASKTKPM